MSVPDPVADRSSGQPPSAGPPPALNAAFLVISLGRMLRDEVDADHWAQIGWFGRFDVDAFYVRLADQLADS